ncbi:MAG: metallophosphoesterase [Verrucomicrobiota bacterium]|nr:metallophosphoesterase [Verrucomicrobiota bacterium]
MLAIATKAYVADEIVLDARLALFHEREGWLAIADLHYGFELSQRAAGRLVPFWGMESSRARLLQLLDEYQPARLLLLGDLVHDAAAKSPLLELLARVGEKCEVVVIAGNHDRQLADTLAFRDVYQTDAFVFHHGNTTCASNGRVQIIGHFHPAAMLRDGAGLRLRFPALYQEENCWIMPAFSPWAGGVVRECSAQSRVWLCTPQRIFPLANEEAD